MKTFVVFWIYLSTISAPCPNEVDGFGDYTGYGCLVNHVQDVINHGSKTFDDREEAFDLYKEGLEKGYKMKIDSIEQ